jgi:hypothetical protein
MSPSEAFEAIGDGLSWYFHVLVQTLRNPKVAFAPTAVPAEGRLLTEESQQFRVDRRLFYFAIASVIFGTVLKTVPGSVPDNAGMIGATVVVLTCWLALSACAHAVARAIGGKANFVESVTITVQVFAAVYVVTNFLALVWFMIRGSWGVAGIGRINSSLDFSPPFRSFLETARAYFLIQGILLAVYCPIAVHNTHRISWRRAIVVFGIIFVLGILFVNLSLYFGSNGKWFFRK